MSHSVKWLLEGPCADAKDFKVQSALGLTIPASRQLCTHSLPPGFFLSRVILLINEYLCITTFFINYTQEMLDPPLWFSYLGSGMQQLFNSVQHH